MTCTKFGDLGFGHLLPIMWKLIHTMTSIRRPYVSSRELWMTI